MFNLTNDVYIVLQIVEKNDKLPPKPFQIFLSGGTDIRKTIFNHSNN